VNALDLNDLYLFAMVVQHGGYSAAERAIDVPKSRLSRRISQLEDDLGARLIHRSTSKFSVTELGETVYQHALNMLHEAESAREAVQSSTSEPRGLVKISMPTALADGLVDALLPQFLLDNPQVRLQVSVSNRRVDLIQEGIDIALRVRSQLSTEYDMVVKQFGSFDELLVASPEYLARSEKLETPQDLLQHVILSMSDDDLRQSWHLHNAKGDVEKISIHPSLMAHNFQILRQAALQGCGVALLPDMFCVQHLNSGRVTEVLPGWRLPIGICHAVYAQYRAAIPAVGALINYFSATIPDKIIQLTKIK
jgi:DNA-binding transcriptional LysR family regulator